MKPNEISDGFGNSWEKCKLGADCGLHVVRPGKAQCWCQDQEASRCEVQAAREEIAKLEDDNERLRGEVKTAKIERDLAGWDDYAVINELERENAALREDKARLDWLATSDHWFNTPADESFTPQSFRAAIDAIRKEAQP